MKREKIDKPVLFINTGWMDFYTGVRNDSISGGGKYVRDHGWGGEIFNFKHWKNRLFGYGQPKIDRKHGNETQIKIEKLGANVEDECIKGITVVWTATNPYNGGTFIVGWYKNATVYRYYQAAPNGSNRRYKGDLVGYFVEGKVPDSKLLPIDERIVSIKRQTKGWMGQSNIWYADQQPGFVKEVNSYIHKGILPAQLRKKVRIGRVPLQQDPLKRAIVEKNAINEVVKYYTKLGFSITSVEKDNVGWDLLAVKKNIELKLEVKGLSGLDFYTELTPNEYKNLLSDRTNYRICIVTNALKRAKLTVFYFSHDTGVWSSEDGFVIAFKEIMSARIYPILK
ncbi:MAG: DUF3883 domain-containing protein [Bacteroidota bacterium]